LGADGLLSEIDDSFNKCINKLTIFVGGDIDGIRPILEFRIVVPNGLLLASLSWGLPSVVIRFRWSSRALYARSAE
jgi:hypothetical protein